MTLTGREAGIDLLETALADCVAGQSRIVLIEAGTGCGKSALVDLVAERAAASGALVLYAVGAPEEQQVPLGVLRQLVNSEQVFALPRPSEGPGAPSRVEAMQAFCAELRELSLDCPVVLCVDDVQYADRESLQYVQYLARHARTAPVLVVVAGAVHAPAQDPAFTTELMRQPHFRRMRLERLTAAEVALVRGRQEPSAHAAETAELHRISGGNPLLLRALVEEAAGREAPESAATGPCAPLFPAPSFPCPEPGGPFAQAVATCLRRSGPDGLALARAAALLGEQATAARVTRLTGLDTAAARRGLAALEASGLLEGLRFRHPAARAAALEECDPQTLTALHREAARVLGEDRGPVLAVAEHLLAACAEGRPLDCGPAEVAVLRDAAEELLVRGDAREAARLLELAARARGDEHVERGIRVRLAQITARFDPAAAERQLGELLEAARAGLLDAEQVQPLAGLLLAQGQFAEAAALLPAALGEPAASALDTLVDATAAVGERLLQSARLTDATVAPLAQAVRSLICSEHPERAVPWSRNLLEEARRCQAPGWSAVFAALHAEALLRMGDLRGAHAHATAALEALPERGGSFPCSPAAVLIRACTAMGRFTEASRLADRQVPKGLLTGLHGLAFLRARGLYRLAVNQPHAALADFLEVGRLMEAGRVDRPAFLPWRTDAAEALLRLGEGTRAEQLALQQLTLPDAQRPYVRGVSLRIKALTGDPKRRTAVLGQAVEALHRSGDRVEAARAMAELGRALQADGSPAKGSAMIRSAWNLAKEAEATALCREILPDAPLTTPAARDRAPSEATPAAGTTAKLSSSEQRVATLAAQGLTNREISAKLYLTVSTVEQHLTRVYRKLQITSRGDLPTGLSPLPHPTPA
ncbi:AAA family ATPase [Streptomyces sp. NBC_01006]|uniref:helix-turn-helix transcriptional regulator n=1 Tax=Streptomyces sp. NBC_01006 TaxID=2903716 RepID=UPI002F91A840|nr:AAA family ATPase [Streptomyces sp. NBC_01006]